MPLVRGKYPTTNPVWSALGQPVNANNPSQPVYTNLSYLGLASAADGAALVTNKLVFVPVPVDTGAIISKVTFIAGGTAPTTTHAYAALYSGQSTAVTSLLLAQSTDLGSTQITASAPASFTLASSVTVTAANAPNGFLYVGIQSTGTVNSAASVSVAAAISGTVGAYFTGGPVTYASSVAATTATAPANLGTPTAVSIAPLVFLS